MKKGLLALLSITMVAFVFSFALAPSIALAEVEDDILRQLEPVQDVYGQDNVDDTTLATAIAGIIQVILGFLGIIFLILILYAGFTWMTAGGNEEKVKKAKDVMVAAVIGVTIVLGAYAITYFVIDSLIQATGVNSGGL